MTIALVTAAVLHATALVAAHGGARAQHSAMARVEVEVIARRPAGAGAVSPAVVHQEPRAAERIAMRGVGQRARARAAANVPVLETAVASEASVVAPPGEVAKGEAAPGSPTVTERAAGAGGAGAAAGVGTSLGGAGAVASGGPSSLEDEGALRRLILARVEAHKRYPELARRRRVEGTVTLSLVVRADGSVDVAVLRGADPMLDEAARDAVLAAAPLPRLRERTQLDLEFRIVDP